MARDGVELLQIVVDAGQQRRTEDARSEARGAEFADGGETQVGAGGAGFEQAGKRGVGGGDGDVENKGVAGGDLLEKIDVAGDEVGLGDEANAQALVSCEDLEQAAGDLDATFDGLVGVGCGADGDLVLIFGEPLGGLAEFLLEKPGGVFFEIDFALEGEGPGLLGDVVGADGRGLDGGGVEEFVGVAGVAVFAGKFAAAEGVDGPCEGELAFGDGFVEYGAGFEGAKLDEVPVVGVGGFGGEAGDPRKAGGAGMGVENGEKGLAGLVLLRHFFASCRLRVRRMQRGVKRIFLPQ